MKRRILYLAIILCVSILFTGCHKEKQTDITPENSEINTQEELEENTFFYYEEEIQQENTETSFGNSEFGYITLSNEYKSQDISSLFDSDMYYLATSQTLGVSFLSSDESLESLIKKNNELEGYIAEKEETVLETDKYKVLKNYGKNDKGNYYGTGFIHNKETSKTIIISIANFVEIDYELFKESCDKIFKSHSYGLF